jgi:hypothetical protein
MRKFLLVAKRIFSPVHQFLLLVSKAMGEVATYVTFTLGFVLFAVVGVIFRLVARDPLDRRIERDRSSYWRSKPEREFDRERYLRQF